MPLPRFASKTSQHQIKIPLRHVLVASFVLQIVAAVGIVGYLSFRNGEIVVEEFAQKSIAQTGKRVEEKLTAVLENTQWVNQLNAEAIDRAELNLQFWHTPRPFMCGDSWHFIDQCYLDSLIQSLCPFRVSQCPMATVLFCTHKLNTCLPPGWTLPLPLQQYLSLLSIRLFQDVSIEPRYLFSSNLSTKPS